MYRQLVVAVLTFLVISPLVNAASPSFLAEDVEIDVYGKLFSVVFEVQNNRNETIKVNLMLNVTRPIRGGYHKIFGNISCLFQSETVYEVSFLFRFFGKIELRLSFEDIVIEKNGFIICGYWFLR